VTDQQGIWIEYMDIRALVPDPDNPKDHDVGAIDESVNVFGFVNPMGINEESGLVIFGHGRLKDLLGKQDRGERPPGNVRLEDGRWLAPVVRGVHLDAEKAKAYVIADNQLTFLGGWNEPKLLANLIELAGPAKIGIGLRGTGFAPDDIDRLERLLNPSDHDDPIPHVDLAAKLQSKWGTVVGQLWRVPSKAVAGVEHRIFCGDCTVPEHIDALMGDRTAALVVTDPPYGIDHIRHRSGKRTRPQEGDEDSEREHYPAIGGDALTGKEFEEFMTGAFRNVVRHVADDAAWYVWHAADNREAVARAMATVGVQVHQEIVWKKDNFYMGRQDYHWQHETALYGWRGKHNFYGARNQSTVWEIRRDKKMMHPTIKPVALYMIPMRNNTHHGEIVLDPFGGSGPVVLGAERTGRLGYALELSPGYVAVILQRCRDMGLEPLLDG